MKNILFLLVLSQISFGVYGQIIADHSVVDEYENIPQEYIDAVKKMWVVVAGESHSAAYRDGLAELESQNFKYSVSVTESDEPESFTEANLRISRGTWGDLDNASGWIYNYGEEDWCCYVNPPVYTYNPDAVARTKAGIAFCNSNEGIKLSAIGFGHCYDDGKGLADSYLRATQEYVDFCKDNNYATKVFFSTGPIDGYMAEGANGYEQYEKWEIIRDYIKTHPNSIFFDYADILSYNNKGERATASWNGHTFPVLHPDNEDGGYTGHIGMVGAVRIAKAMWWMLAKIEGWEGVSTDVDKLNHNQAARLVRADKGSIIVELGDKTEFQEAVLYDLRGKKMSEQPIKSNRCKFYTSDLVSGVYLISLVSSADMETIKVVIKN
ncbi:T9SS type A sorting domain-containing protein [Saccharicrinis sp. GN24d3]|uniref:T9SS type A sorting domain-containing protein n=1 Tax=Saccharicrinis sp. GN24d3 TaxID=3458416 RepID=UPI004035D464